MQRMSERPRTAAAVRRSTDIILSIQARAPHATTSPLQAPQRGSWSAAPRTAATAAAAAYQTAAMPTSRAPATPMKPRVFTEYAVYKGTDRTNLLHSSLSCCCAQRVGAVRRCDWPMHIQAWSPFPTVLSAAFCRICRQGRHVSEGEL